MMLAEEKGGPVRAFWQSSGYEKGGCEKNGYEKKPI